MVYLLGLAVLSFRISAISSVETLRGGSLSADGRIRGGRGTFPSLRGRRSGDVGLVVNEYGEGAVGGGRWINVKSSSGKAVSTAFGLSAKGSGA